MDALVLVDVLQEAPDLGLPAHHQIRFELVVKAQLGRPLVSTQHVQHHLGLELGYKSSSLAHTYVARGVTLGVIAARDVSTMALLLRSEGYVAG
jgi:hypothetical protein